MLVLGATHAWYGGVDWVEFVGRALMLLQMLALFWIGYNLLHEQDLQDTVLWSFAGSCTLLACLQVAGVTAVSENERISALNEGPNTAGSVLALGFIVLLGLLLRGSVNRWVRWLSAASLVVLAVSIIRTGSRGAFVALLAGCMVLMLATKGNSVKRLVNGFAVCLFVALLLALAAHNDAVSARWDETMHGGMAGRENIYPEAWGMVMEKPIAGWGPTINILELGRRDSSPTRDTHNLYLHTLTETGVLGSIPYLLGIGLCWRSAWRGSRRQRVAIALALLAAVFVINLSLTWDNRKLNWLFLAFGAAAEKEGK
jgi:O-antigen ligase